MNQPRWNFFGATDQVLPAFTVVLKDPETFIAIEIIAAASRKPSGMRQATLAAFDDLALGRLPKKEAVSGEA
jgi:hypothetical protein